MKHYLDYKKQYKIVLAILILLPLAFSSAQTVDDLNNKINQKNSDIQQLEQEISQYQSQLDDLGKQKNSLNGSLKQLDLTRKKLTANISVTQNKIDKTNLKIQELSSQIGTKEESISGDLEAIGIGLRETNESDVNSVVETLLSKKNFTETWNDIDNLVTVHEKIGEKILELKQAKSDLEDTRQATTEAKKELVSLKSELADQKKIVDQNTAEKKKLLTQTKNSESNYQKLLKDRLAKKDAFEKELQDYESQLQYVLDPSKLPGGGVLSWPLDNIYITQLFGKTKAGKRLYANGTHNGVDFKASIGTPVKAMADGVVAGTGDTDAECPRVSFGRFVFIKYNDGLAGTFGHLSLIKVSAGEKVVRGEIVGYSGDTGYVTGPHLHLSLYANDAVEMKTLPSKSCPGKMITQPIAATNGYLDPMYYLPKLSSNLISSSGRLAND